MHAVPGVPKYWFYLCAVYFLFKFHVLDRVFYETLIEQNPNSEMAQEWCLAYGILSWERANKLNMLVCKRKGKPVASVASPVAIKGSSNGKSSSAGANGGGNKRGRKVIDDDDVAGDTGLAPSRSWEGMGASGI
jgi:hypothetical protein